MKGRLALALVVTFVLTLVAPVGAALADPIGNVAKNGVRIRLITDAKFAEMRAHYWRSVEPQPPFFEYGTGSVCGGAPGDPDGGNECGRAAMCSHRGLVGPPVAAWRRQVDPKGRPVPGAAWAKIGDTCRPELIPGNDDALTMAMIQKAFHDTDFSVPTVNIQPEGDVTLVNLPTYFEVVFPESGFGPEEMDMVDPARMLGHVVQVRPRLASVTYYLGERSIGPTTSLGGPYPTGDVVATYARPGRHEVRVDIVYTGQYRLGTSGTWLDIPGEVALRGAPVTLTVREARSRLYTQD